MRKHIQTAMTMLPIALYCATTVFAMPVQSRLIAPQTGEPSLMGYHRIEARGAENFTMITTCVPAEGWDSYTFVFWVQACEPTIPLGNIILQSHISTEEAMSYEETGEYRASDVDIVHAAPTNWLDTALPLSSTGTWSANCLPATYEVPPELPDWQYGAYTVNVLTDAGLTITVAGDERNVSASNAVQKLTFKGVAADRSITVAADDPGGDVRLGCCETPLRQFHGEMIYSPFDIETFDVAGAVLTNEWVMIVLRAEITDGGNSVHFEQQGIPLTQKSATASNEKTQALWHPRADGTFERHSRISYLACSMVGLYDDQVASTWGGKLYKGWLADSMLDIIHDLDGERLRDD